MAQALRPYPQYLNIDTRSGAGDRTGHSSYHAWLLRIEKQYAEGITFQGSYVLSKLISDTDQYHEGQHSVDHYNRSLEKSIGQYDQTHNFKFSYIYELPFGKGQRWMNQGIASKLIGGWRIGAFHVYTSGTPLSITNSNSYNIFNSRNAATVTSYEGWIAKHENPDWKGADRFFVPKATFGDQPKDRLGNATRYNPKARLLPNYNENYSLAKSFHLGEVTRIDFRWEAFNIFNRSRFASGSTNIDDPNFGRVLSTLNDPRRMQFALKLYF